MEGYSVTEAASVLGVPTERVWELLARGVLAGHPEGDSGMRVFLQPRPAAPSPMQMPPPAPPPEREPERELSPFRELLTEFRNLTERYGQALLALGEARGEVASLRSRVDLLEARIDLRLPMAPAPIGPPIGWDAPQERTAPPPEPEPEPASVGVAEADDGEASVEPSSPAGLEETAERERRRRPSRHATESFAEALARAEDPTVPELPELHREPTVEPAADAALPRELPVAEPMPTVDEATAPDTTPEPALPEATTEVTEQESDVEPMWAEPGDGGLPEESEPSSEKRADAPEWSFAEPESDAEAEADVEQLRAATAEPEPATAEPRAEPESAPDVEVEPGQPVGPLAWDPERYSTEIGEPDWYAEEEPSLAPVALTAPATWDSTADESAAEEPAPSAGPRSAEEADGESPDEAMAWPENPPPSEPDEPPSPPEDPGGVEAEVAAAGHADAGGPSAAEDRAEDTVDALDALDALSRSAGHEATAHSSTAWSGTGGGAAAHRPSPLGTPSSFEPGSTRPVRPAPTPASRAYRRLRRIFPG